MDVTHAPGHIRNPSFSLPGMLAELMANAAVRSGTGTGRGELMSSTPRGPGVVGLLLGEGFPCWKVSSEL